MSPQGGPEAGGSPAAGASSARAETVSRLGPRAAIPPAWMRKMEALVLMDVFARAFDVEPPRLARLSPEAALLAFRSFTAACMEIAAEHAQLAAYLRGRLGTQAERLGRRVRALLLVRRGRALGVARYFYHGIGIELTGSLPGELRFGPCYFAERYTPQDCWFMSAFDEGFLRGLTGCPEAGLRFSCRLTDGAPCCRARFAQPAPPDGEGAL